MVKLEKKLTPEKKLWQEALRYLNLVEKWVEKISEKNFEKIAQLTWKTLLWTKRFSIYQQNQNDENLNNFWESDLFKKFYTDLQKKYQQKEEKSIA